MYMGVIVASSLVWIQLSCASTAFELRFGTIHGILPGEMAVQNCEEDAESMRHGGEGRGGEECGTRANFSCRPPSPLAHVNLDCRSVL